MKASDTTAVLCSHVEGDDVNHLVFWCHMMIEEVLDVKDPG